MQPAVLVELSVAASRDQMEGENLGADILKYSCSIRAYFLRG